MKIFLAFIIFCLDINQCSAQQEAPPGTFFLGEGIYMDKTPVANIHYVEFLGSLMNFWSPEISVSISTLPLFGLNPREVMRVKDSSWYFKNKPLVDKMEINKPFYKGLDTGLNLKKYLVQEKIRYVPVLGITYEQAAMFCRWRTDMVMLSYGVRTEEKRKKLYSHINYRLPTEEEWKYAFNNAVIKKSLPFFKTPANKKNSFILYNSISELTNIKGTVIGYKMNAVKIEREEDILNSSIGFRCVCEVK